MAESEQVDLPEPELELDDIVYSPMFQAEIPKPRAKIAMPIELRPPVDREQYELLDENPFKLAADTPLSTFSIDVDTAGYSNLRRMIRDGTKPPVDAVRVEEMINYFLLRISRARRRRAVLGVGRGRRLPVAGRSTAWSASGSRRARSTGRIARRATWSSCSTSRAR